MALLAIVMCVNFASCSSDNDEESNGGKSTQELLQGVWYDAYTDDCPYFYCRERLLLLCQPTLNSLLC